MLPLSAIPTSMPVQSLMPRDLDPESIRLPSADLPGIVPPAAAPGVAAAQPADISFANVLGQMVQDVNMKQNAANDAVSALQSGGNVSLHQAVIAMEEASVSFQLMVEVRNKLLDSYQEIMRMQV